MTEEPPLSEESFGGITRKAEKFFYLVGLAITEWAKIDEQLFHICADALRTHGRLAAIVYYRNNTLGGRLVLVEELVKAVMAPDKPIDGEDSDGEKTWKTIKTLADALLKVRNQLAHSPANPRTEFIPHKDPGKPPIMADPWWAIYASTTEQIRGKEPKPEIRLEEIEKHLESLRDLWFMVRNFRDGFSRFPRPPE